LSIKKWLFALSRKEPHQKLYLIFLFLSAKILGGPAMFCGGTFEFLLF